MSLKEDLGLPEEVDPKVKRVKLYKNFCATKEMDYRKRIDETMDDRDNIDEELSWNMAQEDTMVMEGKRRAVIRKIFN